MANPKLTRPRNHLEEQPLNTMANYIVDMATTIQVSNKLLEKLKEMKLHDKESYEEIIWDLIEDSAELSEETKRKLAISEQEIISGKTVSLAEVKRRLKV
jgi:predicted CopG family antitoxin